MNQEEQAGRPRDGGKPSKWHVHRRLYDWVLGWAQTPWGATALFVLSFAESSFFPVPPDVLLAPLTLGDRRKWWRFALSCSVASVLGGLFGYAIGVFLWPEIDTWVFEHMGWSWFTPENFELFRQWYDRWDFWIILAFGFTPFPYKVATITAGMTGINVFGFVIASVVGRSARFFLVAGLFGLYGETIRPFVDRYFNWLCLVFLVLLVGGFLVLKYF